MYQQHFRLNETPFSLTPNTGFFFGLTPHLEALQVLQTALQTGEGFTKVTGEVGTGKTLICRKLINELPSDFHCAYLPNPYLTPQELRWAVAMELGLEYSKDIDQQQLIGLIQKQLMGLAAKGFSVVLVVDEAQAMSDDSLEALRLFTNLETESRKLLQVVLFGQHELDERLKEQKFRQLRQRITFSYNLRPLDRDEIQGYIQHRLMVAGYEGPTLFGAKEVKIITKASRGIPRLINVLCHKAMLLSYGEGCSIVKVAHIRAAIKDTEDTVVAPRRWFWIGSLGVLSLALSVGMTLVGFN